MCAPSNIAVDNLVQKLSKTGVKVVRLGHPARVTTELQKFSLDAILMNRDSSDIIKNVRTDITATIVSASTRILPAFNFLSPMA